MSQTIVYTDMGPDLLLTRPDGSTSVLPRYGVWKWDAGRRRHQVAEVGDDLQELRAKHGDGPLVELAQLRGTPR